jgi:hypothetical protein
MNGVQTPKDIAVPSVNAPTEAPMQTPQNMTIPDVDAPNPY